MDGNLMTPEALIAIPTIRAALEAFIANPNWRNETALGNAIREALNAT